MVPLHSPNPIPGSQESKLGVPIRVLVRLTIPGGDLQISRVGRIYCWTNGNDVGELSNAEHHAGAQELYCGPCVQCAED
jgi:hypothetical protein